MVDAVTKAPPSRSVRQQRFIAVDIRSDCSSLVPALQSAAGVAQFAVLLFLFFTAITNDLRQGLHDKFANSLVIRSRSVVTVPSLVGCLILIVIVGPGPTRRGRACPRRRRARVRLCRGR